MTYEPREFWDRRLSEQFDLRGTGQPALSPDYNRACYALRRSVLDRALREAAFDPRGRRVLDVGCGVGFFTAYYIGRGAAVTGIDIAPISIERLRERHPGARFILGDVSETPLDTRYDLVNAFDVLYHIVDDGRWQAALGHVAAAVEAGGLLLATDTFSDLPALAPHNRMRALGRYRAVLEPLGFALDGCYPTHVLLNSDLGPLRVANRAPALLHALDRMLLALGAGRGPHHNKLLVARRGR